jgi:hypothetical protein
MIALRRMSKAFGGVSKLAEEAELNVNTLYRTLSEEQSRTKEPERASPGHGYEAHTTSPAQTRSLSGLERRLFA